MGRKSAWEDVICFAAVPESVSPNRTSERLRNLGFNVGLASPSAVRFRGSAREFRRRFGVELQPETAGADVVAAQLLRPKETVSSQYPEIDDLVFPSGVAFCRDVSATPLGSPAHTLTLPVGIRDPLRVNPVHAEGHTGRGVRVTMIDSGFWIDHPYFRRHGHKLTKSAFDEVHDKTHGHGTAMLANLLAVAPGAKVSGIALSGTTDQLYALQLAERALPDVVVCCWGTHRRSDPPVDHEQAKVNRLLRAGLEGLAKAGVCVVTAAGNRGQHQSITASSRDVISVGGVNFLGGNLEACDLSLSFDSAVVAGRHVPDVCGLAGSGDGRLIVAPVCPGSWKNRWFSYSGSGPDPRQSGYSCCSGTSSACAQVAGVVALMLSKHPSIRALAPAAKLAEIRRRLARTTPVTAGASATGERAPKACGAGLVNAELACV